MVLTLRTSSSAACRLVRPAQNQYEFEFALWTRDLVRTLIRREFTVSLSAVSVGRLLRTLGLSPQSSSQRPLWRAWQANPDAVQRWRDEQFPAIRKQAKAEGATVYFADEPGLRSDCCRRPLTRPLSRSTRCASPRRGGGARRRGPGRRGGGRPGGRSDHAGPAAPVDRGRALSSGGAGGLASAVAGSSCGRGGAADRPALGVITPRWRSLRAESQRWLPAAAVGRVSIEARQSAAAMCGHGSDRGPARRSHMNVDRLLWRSGWPSAPAKPGTGWRSPPPPNGWTGSPPPTTPPAAARRSIFACR